MRLAFLAPALLLVAGGTAFAMQDTAPPALPGAADVARVTAGTYAADPAHTLVGWRVNHFGFNDYFGQFGNIAGTLTLDPANPAGASVDVTIPVDSLSVVSAGLRTHMLGGDFFDQPAHANARFTSTHVHVMEGGRAHIMGNLTIRGVTRPVTLDARFTGAGTNPFNRKETVGFHATTTIRRSEFGVAYGIPVVSDAVELTITAAFEKQ